MQVNDALIWNFTEVISEEVKLKGLCKLHSPTGAGPRAPTMLFIVPQPTEGSIADIVINIQIEPLLFFRYSLWQ